VAITAALPFAVATAWGQDPRAVTTIGSDANIRRCSQSVVAGDSSDTTVEECTRALNYRRLDRQTQLLLLINRGVTHMRRGRANPLCSILTRLSVAIDRNNAEAHLNRGATLVQIQRNTGRPSPR
jgi:hypothetical protein